MNLENQEDQSKQNIAWWAKPVTLFNRMLNKSDILIPESLIDVPDKERQARLLIRFGILGAIFGTLFAGFYFLIGHIYGAVLISIFTGVFTLLPLVLKRSGNLKRCSNLYLLCTSAVFFGLSLIEGGMHGPAVAWLAVLPLCAMILTSRRDAFIWSAFSVVSVGLFAFWHLRGIEFPVMFPLQVTYLVDAAGFSALIPFMVLLGLIFEATRKKAFSQLESAMKLLSGANERLIKLNTEKNEFLNIAAHDLKNPLSVITGFADLIGSMDDLSEKETKAFAGEISKSATRMLDIVNNLLDVRSIEDNKMSLKKEPCKITDCVSRVHRDFETMAAKKNITMDILHRDPSAIACGDNGAISQILDNLVSNAIKYSPHGSIILIQTMSFEKAIGIEVIDEGPGLSIEDQTNLFQKFSRLTPQPTGDETANGLGLWIVDRIASSMGGKVFCKSVLNEGSTFSLRLPVWAPSIDPPEEQPLDRADFSRRLAENQSDLILPN